jgi:hypothetical protein
MRGVVWSRGMLWAGGLALAMLVEPKCARGQAGGGMEASGSQEGTQKVDVVAMSKLLQQLQSQVQELSDQVKSLKAEQVSARSESAELRKELNAKKTQLIAVSSQPSGDAPAQVAQSDRAPQTTIEDRVAKLEENQQLAAQEAAEQSQTKVESSSKYRVRLTGMLLLNTYANRGSVDNQDFPVLATERNPLASDGTFGGSARQSQIGLEGFGPTIGGARTSAEVQFDFAGGFPDAPNGVSFGIVRLRTGTVRFDWSDTSVIVGQDSLFIAPLAPTSIATLAVPAFAYSGNLWSWAPQVRVEHRFAVGDNSSLLLQGGILDSLSGDTPGTQYTYYRYQTAGENSGQPAYATRLAWTQTAGGQNVTLGLGGYYGRQNWGYARTVDSWAGTADVKVPLGNRFEFTSQFYRGRSTGGLGGGIGQTALWNQSFLDPETEVYGLDSVGGWAQLKYKATSKLQFNGAFGQDNPYASELRQLGGNQTYYYAYPLSKNQSAMANFLYQPKSDVVLSLEYRRLRTYALDSNANSANIINLSVGYIF